MYNETPHFPTDPGLILYVDRSRYIDVMLKTGNKGTTEEEVESKLERLLVLFRYVNGKDVFEAFYKKDLAKRLLLGKSGSFDAEKSMISKLKNECGSQFTNKLEGMFKDVELSKDIMRSFQQSARTQQQIVAAVGEEVDLQVNILTAVHWPTYPQESIKLQPELSQMQDVFKEFYLDKYSGRCLGFLNQLGTCVIKADFLGGKKHEFSVSVFQAVVMLLFNETDQLPFAAIATHTGMEATELKRTLQSLACGKKETRVLRKEPAGREVSEEDVFHVNSKFVNKKYRVKINQIQMKETPEENKKTTEGVFQDRQYQVDACIVRVMKTRKMLTHQLLVAEVSSAQRAGCCLLLAECGLWLAACCVALAAWPWLLDYAACSLLLAPCSLRLVGCCLMLWTHIRWLFASIRSTRSCHFRCGHRM